MVANLAVGDGWADLNHLACGLMAGNQGRRHVVLAVDTAHVAAADAGSMDLNANLSWRKVADKPNVIRQSHAVFGRPFADESLHVVPLSLRRQAAWPLGALNAHCSATACEQQSGHIKEGELS